jgi:hypothetical protein
VTTTAGQTADEPARPSPAEAPTEPLEALTPASTRPLAVVPAPAAPPPYTAPDYWDEGPASPPRPSLRQRIPWLAIATVAGWLVALAVVAAALAVAWQLVQPQLTRPFTYDEAAFAFAGHAVAETGVPLSNVGHMQTETPGDFSRRFNWALWHPPLYVYVLGYVFSRWGESEPPARLIGVICNGAVALLVFLTASVILLRRSRAAPLYAAAGTALYATHPFVIQSALLLDIDGTVLVTSVALLAFAYVLLLSNRRPLRHPLTWLLLGLVAVCLAVSLWAKMTTALALVVAGALYRLVATRPWRPWLALVDLPVVALAGGALFLGTWWLFATLKGMPFWLPFRVLEIEFADAARSTGGWRENPRRLVDMVGHVALWISPYLIALFVWAALARLADLFLAPLARLGRWILRRPAAGGPWGAWPIDFILLSGGAIGAAYLIKLAASFPKYHISMMPLWAVGVAYLLCRYVPSLAWWEVPVYGIVLSGMAGYFVTFVGDRHVIFRGWDFVLPLLVWPAALGFAFLVLSVALNRHHLPRQLAILGLLLTLAWSWGVGLAQAQASYSTAYNYGTTGQKETAAYLNSILRPGQAYVAARDVAYYTHNQLYIDQDTFDHYLDHLAAQGITTFDGRMLGYDVDVLALFLWDPALGARAHAFLEAKYEVAFQALPFLVFVRTAP